jgi:mono/diheme cytochrome c family protein
MHDQPKQEPLEASTFFRDGQGSRPLVEGTVARGELREDEHLYTGKVNGQPATTFPFPITRETMDRGQDRYNIYCAPCHDRAGTGNGMIVQRGYRQPQSFHIDRLREAPPGHFYDAITSGFGAMPDYRAQIRPEDRWAIVAYIRALQLSQHASQADTRR